MKLELEELKKSIAEAEQQIKACEEAIQGYEKECAELTETLTGNRDEVAEAKEAVKHLKDEMAKNNKEINSEHAKAEKIEKSNRDRELEVQELNHKKAKVNKN